jgi:glycosyltransferase involved in cell wall biosynthesis
VSLEPFELLAVTLHFPSPSLAGDGQARYLLSAGEALATLLGKPVRVACLRFGAQAAREETRHFVIERREPTSQPRDYYSVYAPAHLGPALASLAQAAMKAAQELRAAGARVVAWCHGYEAADAAEALRGAGVPVVGVLHSLVAQETKSQLASRLLPGLGAPVPSALHGAVLEGLARASALTRGVLAARQTLSVATLPYRGGGQAPALPSERRSQPETNRGAGAGPPPRFRDSPSLARSAGLALHHLKKLDAERRFLAACDRLVCVGRSFCDSAAALYPEHAQRLSWCFAGAPEAAAPRRSSSGRRRLLLVGRPVFQKGWDVLAEALLLLERAEPDAARSIDLVVVGGLALWPQAQAAFDALRLVTVVDQGALGWAQVRDEYLAAEALLLPSRFEPFGLVLTEAMAAGCSILAFDADGPRDLVEPTFGVVVPLDPVAGRAERFAMALAAHLRRPPQQLEAMSAAARQSSLRYRWDDCAREHFKACRRALGEAS